MGRPPPQILFADSWRRGLTPARFRQYIKLGAIRIDVPAAATSMEVAQAALGQLFPGLPSG